MNYSHVTSCSVYIRCHSGIVREVVATCLGPLTELAPFRINRAAIVHLRNAPCDYVGRNVPLFAKFDVNAETAELEAHKLERPIKI